MFCNQYLLMIDSFGSNGASRSTVEVTYFVDLFSLFPSAPFPLFHETELRDVLDADVLNTK